MVIRRVDSSMLVRGASCICLTAPKRKKSTGRWPILRLVLATRGNVPCNMPAERGANKSDGWGLGSSAAEWSVLPAGGELMRPKAETRSVLRRAVSSARTRKVSFLWYVPSDQQQGPKVETRCAPKSSVVRTYLVGCRPCGTCPATNMRGPCRLTAVVVAVVGRRALPALRSHPRRNSGCGFDENRKQNRYDKNIGEIGGTLPQ